MQIRATATTVEVFVKGRREASHVRSALRGGYTTLPEHMPPSHRAYAEWSPERFERWAERIGPHTTALVRAVLASRRHPQQAYRSCLGILSLAQRQGESRLEAACQRAVHFGLISYRGVKNLLDSGLDNLSIEEVPSAQGPAHDNVRGAEYYQ